MLPLLGPMTGWASFFAGGAAAASSALTTNLAELRPDTTMLRGLHGTLVENMEEVAAPVAATALDATPTKLDTAVDMATEVGCEKRDEQQHLLLLLQDAEGERGREGGRRRCYDALDFIHNFGKGIHLNTDDKGGVEQR